LGYFTKMWDILWSFYTFCVHLIHFYGFGSLHQEKSGNTDVGNSDLIYIPITSWRKHFIFIHSFYLPGANFMITIACQFSATKCCFSLKKNNVKTFYLQ
jgi:hypothetical protein